MILESDFERQPSKDYENSEKKGADTKKEEQYHVILIIQKGVVKRRRKSTGRISAGTMILSEAKAEESRAAERRGPTANRTFSPFFYSAIYLSSPFFNNK